MQQLTGGESVGAGAPKKYKTAAALRRACEDYFDSISCEIEAKYPTGEQIKNVRGEPIRYTVFAKPPSLQELWLKLGISKKTWCNYANSEDPSYQWVTQWAKANVEAYLAGKILEGGKGVQGIIFTLKNNFGWREKTEIEVGEETRNALSANMTMEDKLALILEVADEAANERGIGKD